MDMLKITSLDKRFGDKEVLRGLNLSVPEHSIFGFVGKNGAGKTTTMKMVRMGENGLLFRVKISTENLIASLTISTTWIRNFSLTIMSGRSKTIYAQSVKWKT